MQGLVVPRCQECGADEVFCNTCEILLADRAAQAEVGEAGRLRRRAKVRLRRQIRLAVRRLQRTGVNVRIFLQRILRNLENE